MAEERTPLRLCCVIPAPVAAVASSVCDAQCHSPSSALLAPQWPSFNLPAPRQVASYLLAVGLLRTSLEPQQMASCEPAPDCDTLANPSTSQVQLRALH